MELYGITTPIIKPGDNIIELLARSMNEMDFEFQDGDIMVLSESAVATAENRVINLADIEPSVKAVDLGRRYSIDPREMELILKESDEIIRGIPGFVLTLKNGFLLPNAGIDHSNAPEGHVILLPEDPDTSAREIRRGLEARYNCRIAVIIGDSRTHPLRWGSVGIALGCSGIQAVEDARGKTDLYGKPLKVTRKAVADNLVSAAELLMGEADEGVPAVVVRNAPVAIIENGEGIPQIPMSECLYFGSFTRTNR
ncbi:MAG: coenzyme F420-0:L-glutamate ligase [Methanophagales archaeon ANME-1-THS]|nr:MAG: coenzyme F420-0:L-glutamate ligase [Methanophagales archaeon ANME-1-THS]